MLVHQVCPICGCGLRVEVEHLGRRVICGHCGGECVARDESRRTGMADGGMSLMDRVEQLLGTIGAHRLESAGIRHRQHQAHRLTRHSRFRPEIRDN